MLMSGKPPPLIPCGRIRYKLREPESSMELKSVNVETPKDCNVILGQAHFIKSVDDIYDALASSAAGIRFGVAFCEASGDCLVRCEGNDAELKQKAAEQTLALGCGHSFIIFLKGAYPINVLTQLKAVPEVCNIYAATANPLQVVVAESEQGRGVLEVIDGAKPKGIETEKDVEWRRGFLKKIGYRP
jgi:adenosine/AMP kinase